MESKTDRMLERIAKALESIAKDLHKVTAPARGVADKPGFAPGGYVGGEHIGVVISPSSKGWPPPYGGINSADLLTGSPLPEPVIDSSAFREEKEW